MSNSKSAVRAGQRLSIADPGAEFDRLADLQATWPEVGRFSVWPRRKRGGKVVVLAASPAVAMGSAAAVSSVVSMQGLAGGLSSPHNGPQALFGPVFAVKPPSTRPTLDEWLNDGRRLAEKVRESRAVHREAATDRRFALPHAVWGERSEGDATPDHPANQAVYDPVREAISDWERGGRVAIPAAIFFADQKLHDVHRMRYAVGGNVFEYKGPHVSPAGTRGDRREITGFSDASRHRCLKFMNSVNRTVIEATRVWFVTLTYPKVWDDDPQVWKKQLKAFRKRLERAFGRMGVVWKLEPQKRGAPHFHLLLLVPPAMCRDLRQGERKWRRGRYCTNWRGVHLRTVRNFVSRAWFKVVNSGDVKHLRAGTQVEPLETWDKIVGYVSKYLGKTCVFMDQGSGEVKNVGRFWGVWRPQLWGVRWVEVTLPPEAWPRMRRPLRSLLVKRGRQMRPANGAPPAFQWIGRPRPCSAFLPSEVIERLLSEETPWRSLGMTYSQEYEFRRDLGRSRELEREAARYH